MNFPKSFFILIIGVLLIITFNSCLYDEYEPIDEEQNDCLLNGGNQCWEDYDETSCSSMSGSMGVCEERGCKLNSYGVIYYDYSSYADAYSCTNAGGEWIDNGETVTVDCFINSGYQCYEGYTSEMCSSAAGYTGDCTVSGCQLSSGGYTYYDYYYYYTDSSSCSYAGGYWYGK